MTDIRRVVALYDVHGNLPALEAVLAQPDVAQADCVVVGGDVALGPMPREALRRLEDLGPRVRFLRGNCDRLMVDAFDGRPLPPFPPAVRDSIVWAAAQIDRRQRDFLAALPTTLTVDIDTLGSVMFCHATPRSDEETFCVRTPDERIRPMFSSCRESIVVCGHTHMQFHRLLGGVQIVNAGSVGAPYGARGAFWLSLGPGIDFGHTDYDLDNAAAQIARTSYPERAEFVERAVLNPPSEEQMLALFERAANTG